MLDRTDQPWNNRFQQTLKLVVLVKQTDIVRQALELLVDNLKSVRFIRVRSLTAEATAGLATTDFAVEISVGDRRRTLLVVVKNSGQPRFARQAANELYRALQDNHGAYGIFMAPYISDRGAEICRQEGIGYLDFAGNCHLAFDTVYVSKSGKPNPFLKERRLRSLFAPKASRVLRVLLLNPRGPWTLQALARDASVSLGQTYNVKEQLVEREWVAFQADGTFVLTRPEDLLLQWSLNYKYRKNQVNEFYSLERVSVLEHRLAEACRAAGLRYGLTGFSGAARITPTVRYQRVTAYLDGDIERIKALLDLKPAESGANLALLKPYDEGVFYGSREYENVDVVSPVQVYLDLRSMGGRGQEAAEALLARAIRPTW